MHRLPISPSLSQTVPIQKSIRRQGINAGIFRQTQTPPPAIHWGRKQVLALFQKEKEKQILAHIRLDMRKLSTLFTHQNGNSVIAGKGRATENVVDTFKRKCPHLGKIHSPENIV